MHVVIADYIQIVIFVHCVYMVENGKQMYSSLEFGRVVTLTKPY